MCLYVNLGFNHVALEIGSILCVCVNGDEAAAGELIHNLISCEIKLKKEVGLLKSVKPVVWFQV